MPITSGSSNTSPIVANTRSCHICLHIKYIAVKQSGDIILSQREDSVIISIHFTSLYPKTEASPTFFFRILRIQQPPLGKHSHMGAIFGPSRKRYMLTLRSNLLGLFMNR